MRISQTGEAMRARRRWPATAIMRRLGKPYEIHFFAGAGHGFLRQQDVAAGANLMASEKAWPLTVAFFRRHLKG